MSIKVILEAPSTVSSRGGRRTLRCLWFASVLIVITGSLLPARSAPMCALNSFSISDGVQHFFAYALLTFLPALHERRSLAVLAAAGATLLGVALEFGQLLSDGRTWQYSDIEANAAGACTGMLFALPLRTSPAIQRLINRIQR
jgi:VanZ family protein